MKDAITPNPWSDDLAAPAATQQVAATKNKPAKAALVTEPPPSRADKPTAPKAVDTHTSDFDIDGLMSDFPTAKDLERFVFDQTGIVLNLKGRANKLKYQVAMDVLNGLDVEPKFLGGENPYIDKADMIPEEELKAVPSRDKTLPDRKSVQNTFISRTVPHPDVEYRAQDYKVEVAFRKYNNGMISYEIMGPLMKRPQGEKIDKFGRIRPEIIRWVNPRTGEQVLMRDDGTLTPQGKRLRAMMQSQKVNTSNYWEVWIDREFISVDSSAAHNPWDLTT